VFLQSEHAQGPLIPDAGWRKFKGWISSDLVKASPGGYFFNIIPVKEKYSSTW